jgi:hypothetical protein
LLLDNSIAAVAAGVPVAHRSAIDSWGKILRLCMILIVTIAAPTAATVIASDAA